jgi:hypothetical protein
MSCFVRNRNAAGASGRRWTVARLIPAAVAVFLTVLLGALPSAQTPQDGKSIFRFDTFGSEQLWTDVLQMQHVIAQKVSPNTALSVGLKVDVDALPLQ